MSYVAMDSAAQHTCWDSEEWNGSISLGECAGCDQAAQHPCRFCGYGTAFSTHNNLAHEKNGDTQQIPLHGWRLDKWADSPHIYEEN